MFLRLVYHHPSNESEREREREKEKKYYGTNIQKVNAFSFFSKNLFDLIEQ